MPGCRCAVFSCSNSRIVTKAKGQIVIYHNFPKGNDSVSATTRKEWVRRCKRADKWNPSTSNICSEHFTANDYERDLQNELLGLPIRKKLKKIAVPTVNLPLTVIENRPENIQRHLRLSRRQRQREVQDILNNSSQSQPTNSQICKDSPQIELIICDDLPFAVVENHPEDIQKHERFSRRQRQREDQDILNNSSQSPTTISQISEDSPQIELIMCDETLSMESNYQELLQKYIKLEEQYKLLKRNSRRKIKLLSDQVRYYENKCSKLKSRGNLILVKRKCNRNSDSQSFKEKEMQLLHLIDKEDNVCYKISDKRLKIDIQKKQNIKDKYHSTFV